MPLKSDSHAGPRPGWWMIVAGEGFRLFFPLGAVYAVIWSLTSLLLSARVGLFSLWHIHETLLGVCGAALIGLLTTAAPRWMGAATSPGGPILHLLAALWGIGRIAGLFGPGPLGAIGAIADVGWIAVLVGHYVRLWVRHRTYQRLGVLLWLVIVLGCVLAASVSLVCGDLERASHVLRLTVLAWLGLFALVLIRVTVSVANLVLDPSGATAPFRPHPGRLYLAPSLLLVAMVGELVGLGPAVSGFVLMAVGAAFMDRVGEAFIGRAAVRTECLLPAGASAGAGSGLLLAGWARLVGAPWTEMIGFHVAVVDGLGFSVYAVFCVVPRLCAGGALTQTRATRLGAISLCGSAVLPVAAEFGVNAVSNLCHVLAALLWAGAFLCWLWPVLKGERHEGER